MKRAIVTGSNGFIGKNLIEEIKNDFRKDGVLLRLSYLY